MAITQKQIEAIVDDLASKKDRLEERTLNDVPPEYMGSAIYSYVIEQLKGLIDVE